MVIDGFNSLVISLHLAKELHDMGRFEIVQESFHDKLCYDGHYQNIIESITAIFSDFDSEYFDESGVEIMTFRDDVISGYFVHAWEYGKLHNLHYSQNPYVVEAQAEARKWLSVSMCTNWKLLAYIRSKKSAQKSKLMVITDTCCGCNATDGIAYGLVKLYAWFTSKCAEFKALGSAAIDGNPASIISAKPEHQEVIAA
jgi:hypothetical protein